MEHPGWHHAEARHPGTADMQRTGTRERACGSGTGRSPLREARATRPATSQHRVGRRRRGSDERRRTLLFARELLDAFQQRELRCRYFLLVRSLGVNPFARTGKERFPGLQNRESWAGRRRFGEALAAAVQLLCGWRGLAATRSIAAGCSSGVRTAVLGQPGAVSTIYRWESS